MQRLKERGSRREARSCRRKVALGFELLEVPLMQTLTHKGLVWAAFEAAPCE